MVKKQNPKIAQDFIIFFLYGFSPAHLAAGWYLLATG